MKKIQIIMLLIPFISIPYLSSCKRENSVYAERQAMLDSLKTMVDSLNEIQQTETANKKLVADFYQEFFGDKNIGAIDTFIGETYIQHNPMLPDGKDALRKAAEKWFKDAPKKNVDIHHLGADGNYVYIHTKATLNKEDYSVVDIFRIENGKIVEHWDVIQKVPEESANSHPMF